MSLPSVSLRCAVNGALDVQGKMNTYILSSPTAADMLSKSGSGVYTPACQLHRPASHIRSYPRRAPTKAFTSVVQSKPAAANKLSGTLKILLLLGSNFTAHAMLRAVG